MLGKAKKRLIIVCDEKTEQYANFLRQLISTNDDKDDVIIGVEDGAVDAAVWLEKDYLANKATISSSEHILFVGDNKTSKNEAPSMKIRFEKFGMRYGWLGKRAMMQVSDDQLTTEEYEDFIEFCLGYEAKFENAIEAKKNNKALEKNDKLETEADQPSGEEKRKDRSLITAIATGVGAAILPKKIGIPLVAVHSLKSVSGIVKKRKEIRDQQYKAIAVILYIDGLREFLEG